jgi:hypothetical protein
MRFIKYLFSGTFTFVEFLNVRRIISLLGPVRIGHKTDSDSYKKTVFTTVFAMPCDGMTCDK